MRLPRLTVSSCLVGIFLGLSIGFNPTVLAAPQKPASAQKLPVKDVQRFTNAISQIKNFYVESVTDKKLFEHAIRGMLAGLDPHSAYLNQEEFKELTAVTRGEFSGLGVEVTMKDGLIKVITPIDDSPAAKAGVKAGDLIISLDDTPVKGMSLRDAVKKMRGKIGTSIRLTIVREGEKKPLNVTVKRDVIKLVSVKSKMLDNGYGYVRVSHFQSPSANNVGKAIQKLQQQNKGKLKGLVLDLRNNPGGLLDSAIEISDAFLDSNNLLINKLIVYTKGRIPGATFAARATPGDIAKGIPMVVLINQGSASAAEIVAGALQDHKRAVIIGNVTFGKGSVQTVLPLDNQTGLKLTTALYYTPSGRSIQAEGIHPDVIIKNLDLSKAKKNGPSFNGIKEANLIGHIKNGNQRSGNGKVGSSNGKDLAYTDYQLYEALNLLKGLHVLQSD